MAEAQEILPGITILPYADLETPFDMAGSYGIFMRLPQGHLNIGAILKITEETFQLNLMSMPDIDLPGLEPFDFSENFPSYKDAIEAARLFLISKQHNG